MADSPIVHWFPGHMAKATRMITEYIKKVDVVIELLDARIPRSSANPVITELVGQKPHIVLLNKVDLADPKATKEWTEFFTKQGITVLAIDSKSGKGNKKLISTVERLSKPIIDRWVAKGIRSRSVRTIILGIPNVGKSTLLSRVTNAEPKIANYHFTTLNPNLGVVDLDGAKGFVMADIPGLIEGASEGVGLGHEFLRHIERTKLMIHVVDAAGTEGRDPVDDIHKINAELAAYNPEIAERPQVIAANKTDLIYDPEDDPVQRLKDEFEPKGIKVFPISGATGKGISDLLYYVSNELQKLDQKPVVFEQEYFPDDELIYEDLPYTVEQADGMYVVEGPKIEKMLGYTNLDSEKGFAFFQKFLKDSGILADLERAGIQEGDTVRMYGLQFDYYK